MPFVRVSWFSGRSREQKEKLAKALTQAFTEAAGVPADHTWIVFEDIEKSEWSMGGKLCG